MHILRIVAVALLATVLYGILLDQVTARICVEYFTIGHVRLIDSESPAVLALFWGVVATWWAGLPFGIGLAFASRLGRRPKLVWQQLLKPIGILMGCMFLFAFLAGLTGFFLAKSETVRLVGEIAYRVPSEKHVPFITDLWAHCASYLGGVVGGVLLWFVTWFKLRKPVFGSSSADASLASPAGLG
ncbi:MAG: hypothetical protein EOP88_14370 [Verrucomicrobiaceae bacterium]|nr:MAG: hypothetical protein EOP88_14370 [Verrucomicrobiaceae bacterium]